MSNSSSITEFLLLPFADTWELQLLHFVLFLAIYLAALLGNGLILTAVACDHRLHTPMYFFLLNLALLDLGCISTTLPKAMANSLWDTRAISYAGCAAQVFLFVFLISAEFYLLTVMSYDRYVAICKPLHYGSLLGSRACAQMAAAAWGSGLLNAVLHTASTFSLPLCQGNAVDQFFCEIPQILKLSCSDSYLREVGLLTFSGFVFGGCFVFILLSYLQTFRAVLRMPSEKGQHKAFSTCLPHLFVVSVFISTAAFAGFKSPSISSPSLDLVITVLFSVMPPAVNPLIYSMRNQELKNAIWNVLLQIFFMVPPTVNPLIYSMRNQELKGAATSTCSSGDSSTGCSVDICSAMAPMDCKGTAYYTMGLSMGFRGTSLVYMVVDGPRASSNSMLLALLYVEKMLQRKGLDNHTTDPGFLLLGFSDHPCLPSVCFTVFLIIYLMVLIGNSLIVLITVMDSSLHNPMYFFLRNLSFLEICYTSTTLPKMLVAFLTGDGRISFLGCAAQLYFLTMLGSTECLLLAAMAYDRYVAICDPLRYSLIVNGGFCIRLVVGAWMAVVPVQVGQTYQVFTLPFCASHDLHHFFCDVPPLLELACADTFCNQVTLHTIILVVAVLPFSMIVISYTKIIGAILKMPSVLSRHKAFSTCSSHLGIVTLFYGSAMLVYFKRRSRDSADTDKYLALFYTIVTPMFNPVIYSLRNKDVRIALRRLLWRK
ncbi:uncharacterized protein [Anser cygnoides]|uniref:uncharacterized protein n=1 Tax=Anser cygnoides TaxID=8845 RepID=UPI0034D2CD88